MFTYAQPFKPTHRVVVENDDHEYKLGTLVRKLFVFDVLPFAWLSPPTYSWFSTPQGCWYEDEEGIPQIMYQDELESV